MTHSCCITASFQNACKTPSQGWSAIGFFPWLARLVPARVWSAIGCFCLLAIGQLIWDYASQCFGDVGFPTSAEHRGEHYLNLTSQHLCTHRAPRVREETRVICNGSSTRDCTVHASIRFATHSTSPGTITAHTNSIPDHLLQQDDLATTTTITSNTTLFPSLLTRGWGTRTLQQPGASAKVDTLRATVITHQAAISPGIVICGPTSSATVQLSAPARRTGKCMMH